MRHMWGCPVACGIALILVLTGPSAAVAQETGTQRGALIVADPTNPQSLFNAGMVLLEDGQVAGAISQFERVLRLDPDANPVRVLLGSLYLRIGNPEQAERHLSRAQVIGGMPEDTRADVAAMLAEARDRQKPYAVSGSISFGLQSDTNANGGPDDTATFTSGTAVADVSAVASAEFSVGYDLGYQDGRALNLTGQIYASEFSKDQSPSSQYFSVGAGYIQPTGDGSYVVPNVFASYGRLRGASFRTQVGLGFDSVTVLDPTNRVIVSGRIADEVYSSAAGATNPDRDGVLVALNARLDHVLDPLTQIYAGASGSWKSAAEPYESFSGFTLNAGVSRNFAIAQASGAEILLTAGLDVSVGRAIYDAPDMVNSTTDPRDDVQTSISVFLDYPVSENLALRSRVGWTDNRSNYATEDYDNLGVYLGATYYLDR